MFDAYAQISLQYLQAVIEEQTFEIVSFQNNSHWGFIQHGQPKIHLQYLNIDAPLT